MPQAGPAHRGATAPIESLDTLTHAAMTIITGQQPLEEPPPTDLVVPDQRWPAWHRERIDITMFGRHDKASSHTLLQSPERRAKPRLPTGRARPLPKPPSFLRAILAVLARSLGSGGPFLVPHALLLENEGLVLLPLSKPRRDGGQDGRA